jgi:hypothetical protein
VTANAIVNGRTGQASRLLGTALAIVSGLLGESPGDCQWQPWRLSVDSRGEASGWSVDCRSEVLGLQRRAGKTVTYVSKPCLKFGQDFVGFLGFSDV